MLKLRVYQDECKHFTGIQHPACAAGVPYRSVRDESVSPYRWPCLTHDGKAATTMCEKRELLTQEEHALRDKDFLAAIERASRAVSEGKCIVCGADVAPSRIVGACLYGACGHRQGQVSA